MVPRLVERGKHEIKEKGVKVMKCKICGQYCSSMWLGYRHIWSRHNDIAERFLLSWMELYEGE